MFRVERWNGRHPITWRTVGSAPAIYDARLIYDRLVMEVGRGGARLLEVETRQVVQQFMVPTARSRRLARRA